MVGVGNSGAEIAVDLANGGAPSVFCIARAHAAEHRSSRHVRLPGSGARNRDGPPARIGRRSHRHGRSESLSCFRTSPLMACRRRSGRIPTFCIAASVPILDVGLVDEVRRGRIRVVAALERFEDGSADARRRYPLSTSTP